MSLSVSNPTARLLRNGSRHSERTENPMNLQHEKKTFLFENLSQQLLVMLAVAATLLCFPTLSWGQKPKVNPLTPNIPVAQKPEPAPSTARPMTESDIEAFLDGLVPLQLERDDIAGVAIAVVKDGKVLFAKGYGYVVQRVSGKPFNDYINESILKPLGMQHTTFAQPLPPELKSLMSDGYQLASSPAGSFEVVQAWPAGSVSTSAMDMTHFIIAHLQDGQFNGARIIKPETAERMHSRH